MSLKKTSNKSGNPAKLIPLTLAFDNFYYLLTWIIKVFRCMSVDIKDLFKIGSKEDRRTFLDLVLVSFLLTLNSICPRADFFEILSV